MGRAFAFDPNFKNRGKGRRKGKVSVDHDSVNLTGSVTFYNAPTVGEDQILITSDSNTVKGKSAATATPLFWVVDKADILDTVNRLPGNTETFTNESQAYEYLASSDKYFPVKNETLNVVSTDGLVLDLDTTQKASYPNTGSTWYDVSGNGNDLTLYNNPKYQSGVLNFDGTNDYAQGTLSGINLDSGCTIECVVRRNTTPTAWRTFFNIKSASSNTPFFEFRSGANSQHIYADYYNGSSDYTTTAASFTTGTWGHAVATYDGSGNIKMYFNGELVGTKTGVPSFALGNNPRITVGRAYSNDRPTDISVAKVRVYDKALSASEVKKNYYNSDVGTDNITYALDFNNFMSNPMLTQRSQMAYTYNTWNLGSTSATGFGRNGGSGENIIETNTDPFGNSSVIWAGRNNTVSSDSDGGWNGSSFPIRNTEMYRYSTWVYRQTTGNGYFYLGLNGWNSGGSNVGVKRMNSSLSNNTNPYFWSGNMDSSWGWILVVGHVHPAGTGYIGNHSDSGRYYTNGTKFANISYDYIWRDDNATARHRTYLYYSTNTSTVQLWAYPRVDICDGTEPSIEDLIANAPNKVYDLKDRTVQMLKNNCILEKNYVEFSGQNNAEITMDETITPGNGAWTVNMWVNGDSLSGYNILSNNSGGPVTSAFGFHNNKIMYYHYNNSWTATYGNTTLSTGKWYMLTWVNYSNATMKMYVNGIADSSTFSSTTSNGGPVNAIGRNWTSTNFNGKLSSLFIYNKSLSDVEIGKRFAETKGYFGV